MVRWLPKFPPAFAANMGLETVVDGKHENTAIPVMNSLIESGAIYIRQIYQPQ
jgi:hypothetical protein